MQPKSCDIRLCAAILSVPIWPKTGTRCGTLNTKGRVIKERFHRVQLFCFKTAAGPRGAIRNSINCGDQFREPRFRKVALLASTCRCAQHQTCSDGVETGKASSINRCHCITAHASSEESPPRNGSDIGRERFLQRADIHLIAICSVHARCAAHSNVVHRSLHFEAPEEVSLRIR